jgi:UDP-GlcNAc:undecaprenyl-phosphate GlcNAc-1-phosphate transferase
MNLTIDRLHNATVLSFLTVLVCIQTFILRKSAFEAWYLPLITFLSALVFCQGFKKTAPWLRLIDHPGPLKLQTSPVPNSGGPAFFLTIAIAVALAGITFSGSTASLLWIVLLSASVPFSAGFMDDLKKKTGTIMVRILAETIMALILFFCIQGISSTMSATISLPLTVLIVIVSCNAVNLVDGANGLAGGIVWLAAGNFTILAMLHDNLPAIVFSLMLLGVTTGFLPHNFPRASLFMGNSGSHLLGALIAAIVILLSADSPVLPMYLTCCGIMGLPLIDLVWTVLRRIAMGKQLTRGDREHLYDRMMQRGMGGREVVLVWWGAGAGLGLVALLLYSYFFRFFPK